MTHPTASSFVLLSTLGLTHSMFGPIQLDYRAQSDATFTVSGIGAIRGRYETITSPEDAFHDLTSAVKDLHLRVLRLIHGFLRARSANNDADD